MTSLLHREAAETPQVAERQRAELSEPLRRLGERLRARDPCLVLTCARGSSDHAATFAKYLIETRTGTPVASHAPSVSSVYRTPWRKLDGALFLAISQSGQSPDIVESARAARGAGALVVALVNAPGSPLAEAADVALPLLAGPERSVAASKSFLATLLAVIGLVAAWRQDETLEADLAAAPDVLARAWAMDWFPGLSPLVSARSLFVIGRGLTLGIAQEAALKLKETCALHAEAYSAAEVRHGPMAIAGDGFPALMLPPADVGGEAFASMAKEMAERGARPLLAGTHVPVEAGLSPALAPLAMIMSFYRAAAQLAAARGLDPDRPPYLSKVTRTR